MPAVLNQDLLSYFYYESLTQLTLGLTGNIFIPQITLNFGDFYTANETFFLYFHQFQAIKRDRQL